MALLSYRLYTLSNRPTLILLHGFLGSQMDWLEFIPSLNKHFSILAFDLPGHGSSINLNKRQYNFRDCAQEIVGVIRQQRTNHCFLLGYSLGGRLSLYLALTFPKMFQKLILESASPGLLMRSRRQQRIRTDRQWIKILKTQGLRYFLKKWYRQPIFDSVQKNYRRLRTLINTRMKNKPQELIYSLRGMGLGAQPSLWHHLKRLSIPTLCITGGLDQKIQTLAQVMAQHSPRIQVTILPDSGHNIHFENPKIFLQKIIPFLTQ